MSFEPISKETIKILDISHRLVFYLKDDISETGFSPRIQLERAQLGPIGRASLSVCPSLSLGTPATTRKGRFK
jgi:hypothetical protein